VAIVSASSRSASATTDASTIEREIVVLLGQLGDAGPVGVEDGFAEQLGGGERARDRDLGVWSDAIGEQVGDLGDDKCRDDQGTWRRRQQLDCAPVISVAGRRNRV
jgi:hypothetical protein